MKKNSKKILVVIVALLIIIQFFGLKKNISNEIGLTDITTKYNVPGNVQQILKTSCYDCHSNNTVYPWYAEIQPVGWWLSSHIKDGKRALNFSEYAAYPVRRQYKKLEDINDLVKKDEMPLTSYLIIHKNAKLDNKQKQLIANWTDVLRNTIKTSYPPDSLLKK